MSRTVNLLYLNTYQINSQWSKYENIYQFLKQGIVSSQLIDLLPSVRTLAQLLDVNKNTISKVMEALVWEEYIIVKPKIGYWVNSALVQYKADQLSFTKKKLPIMLPQPQQTQHLKAATIQYETLLSIQRNSKKWLQTSHQDKLYEQAAEQFKSFVAQYLNTAITKAEWLLYAHQYWLKFQLLQSMIQDGDQIIIDRREMQDWPLTQLNTNIHILPFPQPTTDIISTITKQLEVHDSVRCIIIPKHIHLSKMNLLNLLSLCYKYGVLLIQTQQAEHIHVAKHKPHFAKTYDYNNYVIHMIELPHQVAGIICDQSILQRIYQNTIQLDEWDQLKIIHAISEVVQ